MKRSILLFALIAVMSAMTACGTNAPAPESSQTSQTAVSDAEITAETTTAETTAETTADTTSETAAETALNKASVKDIAGVWFEDSLDARTLTINEDGTFTLEYRGGGAKNGTVKAETKVSDDGTEKVWYSLYNIDDLWLEFPGEADGGQILDIYGTPVDETEVHFRRDIAIRDEGIDDPDPNEYGYYPVYSAPATGVSVADLDGSWQCGEKYIYFHDGSFYTGQFVITNEDKTIEEGYVNLEYSLDPDGNKEYWYNLYTNTGEFIMGFGVTGDIPLNDLYAGQSGEPHYEREEMITADSYLGTWAAGRMDAVIEEDAGDYVVSIKWNISASEGAVWEYRCTYDESAGILCCVGAGKRTDYAVNEDGEQTNTDVYDDGSATFKILDGALVWFDEKEDMGDPVEFMR